MPTPAGTPRIPLTRVVEGGSGAFSSRLLHGRPLRRDSRGALFPPGSVFVQQVSLGPPGMRGRHAVVVARAAAPGCRAARLPGVLPGAVLLLRAASQGARRAALGAFRRLRDGGIDPSEASPAWLRDLHARLAAGMEPGPYTHARHAAHLALERAGGREPPAPGRAPWR